ncbi:MAG: hypothetical protein H6642_01770 [Caldilineaceae bacterium]|nr:hypothetical protein [Caldilineaceae bacterium]
MVNLSSLFRCAPMVMGCAGMIFYLMAFGAEPLIAQSDKIISDSSQFSSMMYSNEPPPVAYGAVDVDNSGSCRADGRPATIHGDLNLALRSYEPAAAPPMLMEYDGPTDADAPQLSGLFLDKRLPELVGAYQIYDWDWSCNKDGCRGDLLAEWPMTLLELAGAQGETLSLPSRGPKIDRAGNNAMVLYAEATRLTLAYTRHDSAACGYVVHLEGLQVDPSLVNFYQALDRAGRVQLPGVDNHDRLGAVSGSSVKVAVRDSGRFMDPGARKDWWQMYGEE